MEIEQPVGASPLAGARKVVTVVFCDLVDSTALGERLDAEALDAMLSRYFGAMQAVLEAHGGVPEKFIGDAIMAVFGLPRVREDDALRAVRAAAGMRDRLAVLNDELDRRWGVRLRQRAGVATGEVLVGEPMHGQRMVTGDVVNLAARLEQVAGPGEILLGAATHDLVGERVESDAVSGLALKGRREPVVAHRLERVADGAAALRRGDGALVGREHELAFLRRELDRAVAERRCRLVTILGEAGIGKSRLVEELVATAAGADAVAGRCLPYGTAITFWPLLEILGGLAPAGEDVAAAAARVRELLGDGRPTGAIEETFWAARRLLERLAERRPLIVVLDDLHWADPTLLDLVEYLVGFSAVAPILLVCLARRELLDLRPGWAEPRSDACTLALGPLDEADAAALVDGRPGGASLSPKRRAGILATAEGNPLFLEHLLLSAGDAKQGDAVALPPTIQALLAARIDGLPAEERDVAERAAIEGAVFRAAAVASLGPGADAALVPTRLFSLARRQLVRPEPGAGGGVAFRFAHLLIRDVVYAATPRRRRAELHERFAAWLAGVADAPEPREELLGHHLEQAARHRAALSASDPRAGDLARRAGEHLAVAGGRALDRFDLPAARSLLGRALELLPADHATRPRIAVQLGETLIRAGELRAAADVLAPAERVADAVGDAAAAWRARVALVTARLSMSELSSAEAAAVADAAIGALGRLGDEAGLARAWELAAHARNATGQGFEGAWTRAHEHATAAGDARVETEATFWLGLTGFFEHPVAEARARCGHLAGRATTQLGRTHGAFWLGAVEALAGATERGLVRSRAARATYAELSLKLMHGGTGIPAGILELTVGDAVAAERVLREADRELEEAGEKGWRSMVLGLLAEALCDQRRDAEAWRINAAAADITEPDDRTTLFQLHHVAARLHLAAGSAEDAQRCAREALALGATADPLGLGGARALITLAEGLRLAGSREDARAAAAAAVAAAEWKGAARATERARRLVRELEG